MPETNERDREAMERWVRMCVDDDGMAPELLAAIRDAARLQRAEELLWTSRDLLPARQYAFDTQNKLRDEIDAFLGESHD